MKKYYKLISIIPNDLTKLIKMALAIQTLNKINLPSPILPPDWFVLSTAHVYKALADIASLTNDFSTVEPNYASALIYDLRMRALSYYCNTVVFGFIPGPPITMDPNQEITRQIIGRDGCYLKQTTENCGVDFIYYDYVSNEFMFWGSSRQGVVNAMKIIRSRICRTIEKNARKLAFK